jgi:hypothetical protein
MSAQAPLCPPGREGESSVVTEHDVLVGYRLRLSTLAEKLVNVSRACRLIGVHRSTYCRLKKQVDRWGLEALNVRERRRRRAPTGTFFEAAEGTRTLDLLHGKQTL